MAKSLGSIGAAVAVLYAGWTWCAGQIVWAVDFRAAQEATECRFDKLERVNLEGQLADVTYRISQYTQRRLLTPDEARELAGLRVRQESVQRQITDLGSAAECDRASVRRRQQQNK